MGKVFYTPNYTTPSFERGLHYHSKLDESFARSVSDLSKLTYTPAGKVLMTATTSSCYTLDLQRQDSRIPYSGPISPGMIFAWWPRNAYICETIEVIESTDDRILTRSRQRCADDAWVPITAFRNAVVLSRYKTLPD